MKLLNTCNQTLSESHTPVPARPMLTELKPVVTEPTSFMASGNPYQTGRSNRFFLDLFPNHGRMTTSDVEETSSMTILSRLYST